MLGDEHEGLDAGGVQHPAIITGGYHCKASDLGIDDGSCGLASAAMKADPAQTRQFVDAYIWAVLAIVVGTQTAGSFVAQGVYLLVPFWRDALGVNLAAAALAVTAMNGAQIGTMFLLGRASTAMASAGS
ncbi:MAG TPA: hypothetical protein VGN83_18310 [Falsiroseomonas sp.]|nr:hypothetical protein [Falsiroseomonas sp.]